MRQVRKQARISVGTDGQRGQRDLGRLHARDQVFVAAVVRLAISQQDDVLERGVGVQGSLIGGFERRQDAGPATRSYRCDQVLRASGIVRAAELRWRDDPLEA